MWWVGAQSSRLLRRNWPGDSLREDVEDPDLHISQLLSLDLCCCDSISKSYPTLCDSMDCSPPGSSVHGILQARMLEGVAILFTKGTSQPRDRTCVSCTAGRFFTIWATRKAPKDNKLLQIFPGSGRLQRRCVDVFSPAAFYRWAWSECFLWAKIF